MAVGLLSQFNRLGAVRKSLIRKSLDSATGVGEALVPEKLEAIITNTIVRLSPELAVIEPEYDAQKFHEFNRLTSLPAAGGAQGEGATTPITNSTYARQSVQLKVIRRRGSVTNFLQDASRNYIDAAAAEMENHLVAHIYDLNTYNLWGNAVANQYSHSGLDTFITTEREHFASADAVPTNLNFLDDMIDANLRRQGAPHKKAFLMSPEMQSKVTQLITVGNGGIARINRDATDTETVEIEGGWRLFHYRGIPIIPTSAMAPQQTMTTVTTSTATSGGTVPADDYFFYVAPITYNGEEEASTVASQTTTGTTSTVTLSWTAFPGALYYKIYVGESTGPFNAAPTRIIAATAFDSVGTIGAATTGYTFTSNPLTRDSSVTASQNTNDHPYVAEGGVRPETVVLWDLDKYQGLGKMAYTNTGGSRFRGLVTMEPLAITDDFVPFLIKTYAALVDSWEATSVMRRGLRVA